MRVKPPDAVLQLGKRKGKAPTLYDFQEFS